MAKPSDIDRLLEDGLTRYGSGDFDGALEAWEQVLALEPDHAQAASYVDYVRMNYELLQQIEPQASDGGAPFGIEEVPEYQIEIVPGQLTRQPAGAPMYMDPLDQGWFMEEETQERGQPVAEPAPEVYELEADEPPAPVSFEEATREYASAPPPASRALTPDFASPELPTTEFQPEDPTGGFTGQGTPVGFHTEETEIRKRELGFVQPVDSPRRPTAGVPSTDGSEFELAPSSRALTPDLLLPPRMPASGDQDLAQGSELERAPTRQLGELLVTAPTRELGLRPAGRAATGLDDEDVPTKQSDASAFREEQARDQRGRSRPATESTRHDIVLPFDPIDARSAQILDDVDADAPAGELGDDRTRRRITGLFDRAVAWAGITEYDKAVAAVDLALSEDPNSPLAQKLIHRNRDTIMTVFQAFLGDLERQPQLARPLHELASAPISPRAAFLLSRIDGTLTIDEILDVSGMPRMEAYRHLCQLFLRGILK